VVLGNVPLGLPLWTTLLWLAVVVLILAVVVRVVLELAQAFQ
jgi:hypothetical protein